jgi:hypothetical protein
MFLVIKYDYIIVLLMMVYEVATVQYSSVQCTKVQFLYLKSFVGILPPLQLGFGHMEFEDIDVSMVCVLWFVPRSHV